MLKREDNIRLWREWFSLNISHRYPVFSKMIDYLKLIDQGLISPYDRPLYQRMVRTIDARFVKSSEREIEEFYKRDEGVQYNIVYPTTYTIPLLARLKNI